VLEVQFALDLNGAQEDVVELTKHRPGPLVYVPLQDAEKLQVTRRTVNRWIEDGQLVAIKFAPGQGRVRVAESDLKDFLERRRTRPE
jgi:excisionase family DNA binding protein